MLLVCNIYIPSDSRFLYQDIQLSATPIAPKTIKISIDRHGRQITHRHFFESRLPPKCFFPASPVSCYCHWYVTDQRLGRLLDTALAKYLPLTRLLDGGNIVQIYLSASNIMIIYILQLICNVLLTVFDEASNTCIATGFVAEKIVYRAGNTRTTYSSTCMNGGNMVVVLSQKKLVAFARCQIRRKNKYPVISSLTQKQINKLLYFVHTLGHVSSRPVQCARSIQVNLLAYDTIIARSTREPYFRSVNRPILECFNTSSSQR